MKLHMVVICTLGIFLNVACAMSKAPVPLEKQIIPLILKYSEKLKKEQDIDLTMYGLDWAGPDNIYDGKVHLIDVGFSIERRMNIEEARRLFYDIVDGLLGIFNGNEMFRETFYHYPVGYEDLYFRLSFDHAHKGFLQKNNISMIAILENEIMYFIVEEEGGNIGLESQQLVPDVSITTGISPKTRCITKKLPERVL